MGSQTIGVHLQQVMWSSAGSCAHASGYACSVAICGVSAQPGTGLEKSAVDFPEVQETDVEDKAAC
jgi:hypothetical protein